MGLSKYDLRKCYKCMWLFVPALLLIFAVGCSSSGGSSSGGGDSDDSDSQRAFPASLAVASPLDLTSDSGSAALARNLSAKAITDTGADSRYSELIEEINDILEGSSVSACTFDPALFFQVVTNATCYGPTVPYENHPDALTPNSGELPSGDVGIWLAIDPSSGDACAAAELNARMEGIQARALGALSGLAAMVCTINASEGSLSLPDADNTSVDLTSEMPEPDNVTLNSAILSYATTTAGEDKYAYTLDFDFDSDHISVGLVHIPDADSTSTYRGQLYYQISTSLDNGSNCPMVSSSVPVTRNGSLVYNRTSDSAMTVEMREGQFCGTGVDGLNTDYVVDATDKFDSVSAPNGWGDDFNLFRADFDPSTQLGDYAYAWQAGHHDGNTRVFNLNVYDDNNATTEDLEATAFFGFGRDAENADPSINGFIFNWAGPGGGDHTLQEYAQKQTVSYNSSTGIFDSDTALITYAPTNSGTYDGSGSFTFDSDADGTVDTDAGAAIAINLASASDDGTGTYTIEQTIEDAGIVVPDQPTCLECTPE